MKVKAQQICFGASHFLSLAFNSIAGQHELFINCISRQLNVPAIVVVFTFGECQAYQSNETFLMI